MKHHPLLHPVVLASLALLVLNDHVFKRLWPSWITGKLSDFAGVFFLPLFLATFFEVLAVQVSRGGHTSGARAARLPPRLWNRTLLLSVAATALVFAFVELTPSGDRFYSYSIGVLQWPFRAVAGVLRGEPLPGVMFVRATPDSTDLVALPMALLALRFGWMSASAANVASTRATVLPERL